MLQGYFQRFEMSQLQKCSTNHTKITRMPEKVVLEVVVLNVFLKNIFLRANVLNLNKKG